jgi:cysteine desulfurase
MQESVMPVSPIYLDNNATTRVMPAALAAAQTAMAEVFGNPSSGHCTGLVARQMLMKARHHTAQVLDSGEGQLIFMSGATEGIQSAVFSALMNIRQRRDRGERVGRLLVYGATEHKAVPEALRHWNAVLGLDLEVRALPVCGHGQHQLELLAQWMADTALLCTMAANNETGVVSDLVGIERVLTAHNPAALWLVDCVQALGKLPLKLRQTRMDYATFSGHKLYGPKGIGLLYVRAGSPYTAMMAGGGQEGGLRAGTENMPGIAAWGAVMQALLEGRTFQSGSRLLAHREQLARALSTAFPGVVFNAPFSLAVPTTLNFSVPGVSSNTLLALFDAAGVRVSAGSACSAAKAEPSYVLVAMGLPEWQTTSAVRLSFGPLDDGALIERACAAILRCGEVLAHARDHVAPSISLPPASISRPKADADQALLPVAALTWGELAAFLNQHPDTRVVDVRENYEHLVGTPHAFASQVVNVPLDRLDQHLLDWLAEPARPVVFFCRTGNRSHQAAQQLLRQGHPHIHHLAGGLALS